MFSDALLSTKDENVFLSRLTLIICKAVLKFLTIFHLFYLKSSVFRNHESIKVIFNKGYLSNHFFAFCTDFKNRILTTSKCIFVFLFSLNILSLD